MSEVFPAIIVGAGQAGLSCSYYLRQAGVEHIILEKDAIASSWHKRWDSFTLVTPNWMNKLPGFDNTKFDPEIFLTKIDVINYLEEYAQFIDAPVTLGVEVNTIELDTESKLYKIDSSDGVYYAANVIIAAGLFQEPRISALNDKIAGDIKQIHSSEYTSPDSVTAGVLVVGNGQSGAQIAEELLFSNKKVFLATSKAGRVPRRYRGKDITEWMQMMGSMDKKAPSLDELGGRFPANPHLSGKDGGHTINLWELASAGMHLCGRVKDARDYIITFDSDLMENMQLADKTASDLKKNIDDFIVEKGLTAPVDKQKQVVRKLELESITEINLKEQGIQTIIWATGYQYNFDWIEASVFDQFGYPKTQTGSSDSPGLYFIGLHFLNKIKSGLLYGVGEDAKHITDDIINDIGKAHAN